jgi:hypothetical protein
VSQSTTFQLSASSSSVAEQIVLEGAGIVKRYPGVVALNQVNFAVRRGEVHGLEMAVEKKASLAAENLVLAVEKKAT